MTRLSVNGAAVTASSAPTARLSHVLREELRLTGTKTGCDAGDCGACTVLVNGRAVCACLMPLAQAEGAEVLTVEGLARDGTLSDLQDSFLRHGAAQCGICTPGMLMAAKALLDRTARPTRQQAEDALGGVLCRCTGYTKIIDAVCDVGGTGAAPVPAAGGAVGAALPRIDGTDKVTGAELFGADVRPEGTWLVRAVRAPHAAAGFTLGDTAGWGAARGVTVLTAADLPGPNAFGVIPDFVDQPVLAVSDTRFRGEAIALVAGPEAQVRDLDLSDFPVTWTPQDPVTDPAAAAGARAVLPDRPDNVLIRGLVRCGDPDAALPGSAHRARISVETPFVEHAYIEPEAGSAWMEGDVLNIRACTQAPVLDRDEVARLMCLPPDRVRMRPSGTGGGFGAKLDLSVQPLLALAVLKTGHPCRMVWTRQESFQASTKRHPSRMTAEIGCDLEGRLTGMVFDGTFDTGAYASWGPTVANRVPVHASGPYRLRHYRAEAVAMHTNNPAAGAFRGFGVPQAAIVQEALFDMLAMDLDMDRLDFRRRNALRDGQTTVCGQELSGVGISACLDALAPRWAQAMKVALDWNVSNAAIRRGVGIASCWYGCGNTSLPNPSTIRVGLTRTGRLVLHQGAADIGQGANTVIAQICADAVGLPMSALDIVGTDTAVTPDGGKTSASRQTYVTGKAALLAGQALRADILRGLNKGDGAKLSLDGTVLRAEDGAGPADLDLAGLEAAGDYVLEAQESYDPPTRPLDENGQGVPYAVYGYGAQIAEVEVDLRVGTTRVHRITAAHDLGRVINPLLAEGQVQGGIAQGLGMALMEEYLPGRTENLHYYLIPTTGDMPEIETIFVEVPDPEGPLGAKGLGEHALIPTAPAILNAIAHASGVRITTLPALPHRIRAALRTPT